MLPIDHLSIILAADLQPGDFAYLHDFKNQPALVASSQSGKVALLVSATGPYQVLADYELLGFATKVRDWRIEVDPASIQVEHAESGNRGKLVVQGAELCFLALDAEQGWKVIKIADWPNEAPRGLIAIPRWRVVTRINDAMHVLFESRAVKGEEGQAAKH